MNIKKSFNKFFLVLLSLLTGLLTVLIVNELFKGLVAFIFTGSGVEFAWRGIMLDASIRAGEFHSMASYTAIFLSPYLLSIVLIEISLMMMARTANDRFRSSIIIFQLVNIGYLIFTTVLGILTLVLKTSVSTNWSKLMEFGHYSRGQKIMFMFFILILLLTYINILTKRIRTNIPVMSK
jgi:hypothetical protein